MMIDPPPSRVRRCLIFGFTSHILKIRQQTTVLTQRIHMNTKLSTTISYSLNNLLHYICVPVHKKTTTTKPHGFKESVKTFTLIIPGIGKMALFFNQNCLTAEVSSRVRLTKPLIRVSSCLTKFCTIWSQFHSTLNVLITFVFISFQAQGNCVDDTIDLFG